eukprot:1752795-Amphidinium_carterae.1
MEMQQLHDESNAQLHDHGPDRYRLRGSHRYDPVTGDLSERAYINLQMKGIWLKNSSTMDKMFIVHGMFWQKVF